MKGFLARRLLRALVALWGVSTIVFVVMHLSGDPVQLLLPPEAPASEVEAYRHQLGLDAPLQVQYLLFLRRAAAGDFGRSLRYDRQAIDLAVERLPATLELAVVAGVLAVLVAVPIGTLSAMKPNSPLDHLSMLLALIGQSAPSFYIGIMLILLFSVNLRLLPTGGRGEPSQIILPALTLGAFAMASIARLTRSEMLEVIRQDYIRTARSKGLGAWTIVARHALKNAAVPVVTIVGLQFGLLLGGAVVTETVFSWPGIGRLAIQSIYGRDYPVVQAVVFLTATMFAVLNFLTDLTYGLLDPRLRST